MDVSGKSIKSHKGTIKCSSYGGSGKAACEAAGGAILQTCHELMILECGQVTHLDG